MKKVEFTPENVEKYLKDRRNAAWNFFTYMEFDVEEKTCFLHTSDFNIVRANALADFCKRFDVVYHIETQHELFTIAVYRL